MVYDIVIVGAGVAGLFTALEIKKINPNLKIQILEKYKEAGGRASTHYETYKGEKIQYEKGAGRLHSSHKQLISLLRKYNLHTYKMADEIQWRAFGDVKSTDNNFIDIWQAISDVLKELPEDVKRTHTLRELTVSTLGAEQTLRLFDKYPYRAELEIMSADSSFDLFESMRTGYFMGVTAGFTALIEALVADVKKNHIQIKYDTTVKTLRYDEVKEIYEVTTDEVIQAKRVILAIPQQALLTIFPFSPDHPLIKSVRMEPLMRIYSLYPEAEWFPEARVVTNSPLRYIIPVNKEKRLIMSSYLDSRDIELWTDLEKKANNDKLIQKIQNETQALFPELSIPEPLFTKAYLWHDGCSYWLPGATNYRKLSSEALHPMPETYPNLHIVGESFSKKQQWIEGALEHASELIGALKEKLKE
jgi:protoporphyrinogen oxidase